MTQIQKTNWSKEEDKYLIDNYLVLDLDVIINHLNRTKRAIIVRAKKFELVKRPTKIWTSEEITEIKKLYPKYGSLETSKKLNRSFDSVWKLVSRLGIKRKYNYQNIKKKFLIEEYVKNRKSIIKLSKETGYTPDDIYTALNRFNIQIDKKTCIMEISMDYGKVLPKLVVLIGLVYNILQKREILILI